jgi:hypothetical protein
MATDSYREGKRLQSRMVDTRETHPLRRDGPSLHLEGDSACPARPIRRPDVPRGEFIRGAVRNQEAAFWQWAVFQDVERRAMRWLSLLRRPSVIRRLSHAGALSRRCYDGKSPIQWIQKSISSCALVARALFRDAFVPLACAPGVRCCQVIGSVVSPHDGHSVSFQVAPLVDFGIEGTS